MADAATPAWFLAIDATDADALTEALRHRSSDALIAPRPSWNARQRLLFGRVLDAFGHRDLARRGYQQLAVGCWIPADVREAAAAAAGMPPHLARPVPRHRQRRPSVPGAPAWLTAALAPAYRLVGLDRDGRRAVLHLVAGRSRSLSVVVDAQGSGRSRIRLGSLEFSYRDLTALSPAQGEAVCADLARRLRPHSSELRTLAARGHATPAPEGMRADEVLAHADTWLADGHPEDAATVALAAFAQGQWERALEVCGQLSTDADAATLPEAIARSIEAGVLGHRDALPPWEDRLVSDPRTPRPLLAALARAQEMPAAALSWFGPLESTGDQVAVRRALAGASGTATAGEGLQALPPLPQLCDDDAGLPGLLTRMDRHDLAVDLVDRLAAAGHGERAAAWRATFALWERRSGDARRHAVDGWPAESFTRRRLEAASRLLDGADARPALEALVAERPKDSEARTWLAEACLRAGDLDAAIAHGIEAGNRQAHLPAQILHPLACLRQQGDRLTFDGFFDGFLPEVLPGLIDREVDALRRGGPSAWIAGLEEALDRLGGNRSAWRVALRDGRLCGLAVPPSVRVRSDRMQFRVGLEPLPRIFDRYDALAAECPWSPQPWTFRGELLLWAGRYAEAADAFRTALGVKDCRWGYVGLAAAALLQGRDGDAVEAVDSMNDVYEPVERATTPVYQGLMARRAGDLDAAESHLRTSVEAAPSRVGGWVERGLAARARGDGALAQRCVDEVRARAPGLAFRARPLAGRTATEPLTGDAIEPFLQACLALLVANRASRMVTVVEGGELLRLPEPTPWSEVAQEALRFALTPAPSADPWTPEALNRPPPRAPIVGRPRHDRRLARDFAEHGVVRLPGAIPRARQRHWVHTALRRIEQDPARWTAEGPTALPGPRIDLEDPTTWPAERVTFLGDRQSPIRLFSERADAAVDLLLGGQNRLARPGFSNFLILHRGAPRAERERVFWHVDEPSAEARLDTLRLGLLVLVLLSDVEDPRDGTAFIPGSAGALARRLAGAEGLDLSDNTVAEELADGAPPLTAHGRAGDVFLLHPWTVHGAAGAPPGTLRLLANPNLLLSGPVYRPDRPDSPVERLIVDALR